MTRNNYLLLGGIIVLAIAGYIYFSRTDKPKAVEEQKANLSESIDPKDILKYDPNAPAWMQDAESCTRVDGKIFCKLKGE